MLAERRQPAHEYYVAVLNDRVSQGPVLVASAQGGMNIEEVAAKDPNAIITTPINFERGFSKGEAISIAKKLGFSDESTQLQAANIFINLYRIFKEKDATQIEINPMALTTDGQVLWYELSCSSVGTFSNFILAWMPSLALTTMLSSANRISSLCETSPRKNPLKSKPRKPT